MNKRLTAAAGVAALLLLLSMGAFATAPAGGLAAPAAPNTPAAPAAPVEEPAAPAAPVPVGLRILCPSPANGTISPGRDFYVTGAITGTVPEGSRLSVTLTAATGDKRVLRSVYADIKDNREGLLFGDELSLEERSMLSGSGMPDLVYDPADPDSFHDAWRKCYYDDSSFSALILGGRYRSDNLRLVDETGRAYQLLGAGDYTIVVSVEHEGETLASTSRRIQLGVTPNKVITAEAPQAHYDRVTAEAAANNQTIFTDPLPGRWTINYPNAAEVDDTLYEIAGKWKQALRAEYSQGRSHLYLYNLTEDDPANTVALGLLQQQNVVDVPERLRCYYYDIGEPSLPYLPHRTAELVGFGVREKMAFTRAESSTLAAGDNYYDATTPFHGMIDFVVSDGIDVQPGETLSLFGVTAPIQNRSYELTEHIDHSVTVGNRIASVRYTIEGAGVSLTLEKPVELTRLLEGERSTSIYEFRHTFSIGADWAGKLLQVRVQGVDARGRDVEQALSRFQLRVAADLVTEEEQAGEGVHEAQGSQPALPASPTQPPLRGPGGVIRDT